MRTRVYVTIDTESSMGGAWADPERRPLPADRHVFCRTPERDLGIPLIVDELSRRGLRGTFFVETLAGLVLGRDDTRSITDFLLAHDQDVQLHAHPTFRHYRDYRAALETGTAVENPWECDQLSAHDIAVQRELLDDALAEFVAATGWRPVAFRAGGFAADHRTLRILADLGIGLDTSFNPIYRQSNLSFRDDAPEVNRVARVAGVWELPVTVARTRLPEGVGLKHLDPTAISGAELATALDGCHAAGMRHVVTILHSFSAVKPRDCTYAELRPNRVVIARLRRFLDHLQRHADRFEVVTFADLAAHPEWLEGEQPAPVPDLGLLRPAMRKVVQAVNNLYWV